MNYNELLAEIKKCFIEKLEQIVKEEAYRANPDLGKEGYLDNVYTDIMALGYNFGNIKKATDDIYEMQSALFSESRKLYKHIQIRVMETDMLYPSIIEIFSSFHKATQVNEDFEKVLTNTKLSLEKL